MAETCGLAPNTPPPEYKFAPYPYKVVIGYSPGNNISNNARDWLKNNVYYENDARVLRWDAWYAFNSVTYFFRSQADETIFRLLL